MIKSVGGIVFHKNKYLLQLRDNKKNIYFPGFWSLFGGLLNKKEKFIKAIVREIKEETNLNVRITKTVMLNKFTISRSKKIRKRIYYECKIIGKKNIILREGKKYKFFKYHQINKLNIVPLDLAAIKYHYLSVVKKVKYLP